MSLELQHHHRDLVPDGSCLLAYRGSIAHNMYIPGTDPNSIDDVDLMGVVIGSERNYFGLHDWAPRNTKEIKQGQYDCVYYEIRKTFGLLLKGNPNVLSLLWLRPQDYLLLTDPGRRLLAARDLFAGRHVYDAFAGYAHDQLSKMETRDPAELRMYLALTAEAKARGIHPQHKGVVTQLEEGDGSVTNELMVTGDMKDSVLLQHLVAYTKKGDNLGYLGDKRKRLVLEHGYDSKNAAHCIRLLRMAKEYLATGVMTVFRHDDAQELLDIKRGKWILSDVKALAQQLFAEMKAGKESSPLPDAPDWPAAEQLLVSLLRDHFRACNSVD